MAVRLSIGTGNFTTAGTWGLVDNTSYLNSETGLETLTTAYSGTRSSGFTPGAITVAGIAVRLGSRTNTTGTMSVELYNNGLAAAVAGTEVVINTADLPAATSGAVDGGWIYFEFASPVTLIAATSYSVEAKTSSASQVTLFRDGTTDNICRALVTTTTGAPAAGDDLIIVGKYTGTGASTSFTVTMDNTATTDFGSGSTSLVTPSLAIGSKGTLTSGVSTSTAYYLRQSGNVVVYRGGTLNLGTVASPMPGSSSFVLEFDSVTNVDFGLTVRAGGTWVSQGNAVSTFKTLLTANVAAAGTVLTVASTSGWSAGDVLCIASTTQTYSECESATILSVDSATQVTLTAGVTYAHSGTSPTQGEVGNLTRNVKIRGISSSLHGYITINAGATANIDYTEFYDLGSAITLKHGIEIQTTTTAGSTDIQYSSVHDFTTTNSLAVYITSGAAGNITYSNNVSYNTSNAHITLGATTAGVCVVDNNLFMLTQSNTTRIANLLDIGLTFTNNTLVGCSGADFNYSALYLSESGAAMGTIDNNTVHSNRGGGCGIEGLRMSGTISNLVSWRNPIGGFVFQNADATCDLVLESPTFFGNGSQNVYILGAPVGRFTINNGVFNAGSTFAAPIGISMGGAANLLLNSCSFGATTTHATGDLSFTNVNIQLGGAANNCLFASSTEMANQNNMAVSAAFGSSRHDQTAGNHKAWKRYGTITIDTTIYRSASPSARGTPISASGKLVISTKRVAVNNGQSVSPAVFVRQSVSGDGTAYNGNRLRLIVKRNDAIGITADTVLATATSSSSGAWEKISGATISVTDNGVAEFIVDCDGTAGWANVDDWSVA